MKQNQIIKIIYCINCKWMLRSTWIAQELLSTFENDMIEIILSPSDNTGIFQILLNDEIIWDFKILRKFPQAKELKQIVRDKILPGKNLGHIDN